VGAQVTLDVNGDVDAAHRVVNAHWPAVPGDHRQVAWLVATLTLRLEAVGTASPAGKTVRKVPADPLMSVTLRTTDWASEAPTGPGAIYPVTWKLIDGLGRGCPRALGGIADAAGAARVADPVAAQPYSAGSLRPFHSKLS